jgi:hypothetical protein
VATQYEAPPPGMLARTMVNLSSGQVVQDFITPAQQAEEVAAFERNVARTQALAKGERVPLDSVVHDGTCASSDIMMFTGTSYTGNEICFYESATGGAETYLGSFSAGFHVTWVGTTTQSYHTNSQYGCWAASGSAYEDVTSWNFGTSVSIANLGTDLSGLDYLWLGVTGCGTE